MNDAVILAAVTLFLLVFAIIMLAELRAIVKAAMAGDHPEKYKSDPAFIRSMRLLNKWLSPMQRKQFKQTKTFDVIGGLTGKRYRIDGSERKPYNITEFAGDGKPIGKWCIVTNDFRLPLGDVLLMQKLSLEADESEALRIANKNGMYFYGEPTGQPPY